MDPFYELFSYTFGNKKSSQPDVLVVGLVSFQALIYCLMHDFPAYASYYAGLQKNCLFRLLFLRATMESRKHSSVGGVGPLPLLIAALCSPYPNIILLDVVYPFGTVGGISDASGQQCIIVMKMKHL